MSVQSGRARPSIESAGERGPSSASAAASKERQWVSQLRPVGYSFADQVFSVGATFLANVVLARTQSKEHYGMFALSYSIFTFLSVVHNSTVVEPYLVYGAGRYRGRFAEYLRLMLKANAAFGAAVTTLVLLACCVLRLTLPQFASPALWGLGLAVGVLLSGVFLRRVYYLEKRPQYAARASLINFVTVAVAICCAVRFHVLSDFSVFVILALGWVVAGIDSVGNLDLGTGQSSFLESQPDYWREHWKYAKWVLATAFVFQLTTQGYYWIVAGFVSVTEVAELRVMQMLVTPIDQVFIAMSYLVIPALAARCSSSKRIDSYLKLTNRYLLLTIGVTALFALGVRVAGRTLMHWLYAGKFDDLAPLLSILAFLPLVMGIGNALFE